MKTRMLSAALSGAVIATATIASAGNITPPPADPIVQAPPAPLIFNWSGGYAGLQFGLLNSSIDTNVGLFEDDYKFGTNVDGSEIGLYGGYNWQGNGPWVYGVDAEYNWVNGDDDATIDIEQLGGAPSTTKAQIDATGAIRGRVGYSAGRALFYGTLGFAYIDYEVKNEVEGNSDSSAGDNWGWTAGVGMDYAFTDNWIGRLDYRYSEYDSESGSWYEGDSKYKIDLNTSEIRLGVAYRF